MYFFAILIAILSTLSYHILIRSISSSHISPFVILLIIYLVSITLAFIILMFSGGFSFHDIVGIRDKWKYLLTGVSIFGVELGYILAYRSGWDINITAIVANTSAAILIIPIGYILFNEPISAIKLTGIALCITGLVLINS